MVGCWNWSILIINTMLFMTVPSSTVEKQSIDIRTFVPHPIHTLSSFVHTSDVGNVNKFWTIVSIGPTMNEPWTNNNCNWKIGWCTTNAKGQKLQHVSLPNWLSRSVPYSHPYPLLWNRFCAWEFVDSDRKGDIFNIKLFFRNFGQMLKKIKLFLPILLSQQHHGIFENISFLTRFRNYCNFVGK